MTLFFLRLGIWGIAKLPTTAILDRQSVVHGSGWIRLPEIPTRNHCPKPLPEITFSICCLHLK